MMIDRKTQNNSGTLYMVATPIGNLEDITLRALRVLKEVDCILCEDTRHTKKLLGHYEISTRTESFHAHSDFSKMEKIAQWLEEGKNLALVSDAGTPLVSDPGSPLLLYLRERLGENASIVAVPGASALTAVLSIVPIQSGRFRFLGFLPHKKGRQTIIKTMSQSSETHVLYESSHRIVKFLEEMVKDFPEARVWIAREITKQFEEVLSGTPAYLHQLLTTSVHKQKGEFVVIVAKF
jgi:16S rRNA (cytidine1402-2'-O)-methyltransferase